MAQIELDREDLFLEAAGLSPKVELNVAGQICLVGFGKHSTVSFYFGQDLMLRFDGGGKLRRAFDSGLLLRAAAKGQIDVLTRQRTDSATILHSQIMLEPDRDNFFTKATKALSQLLLAIDSQNVSILRCEPNDAATVLAQIRAFLEPIVNKPIQVADGMRRLTD